MEVREAQTDRSKGETRNPRTTPWVRCACGRESAGLTGQGGWLGSGVNPLRLGQKACIREGGSRDLPNRALCCSAKLAVPVLDHEQVATAHRLRLSIRYNAGFGNERRRARHRPDVVDLVLRGHAVPEHGSACKGQGVVGQIRDHATMHEAVLLQVLVTHGKFKPGAAGFEALEFGAEQSAERLALQGAPTQGQKVGVHPASQPSEDFGIRSIPVRGNVRRCGWRRAGARAASRVEYFPSTLPVKRAAAAGRGVWGSHS